MTKAKKISDNLDANDNNIDLKELIKSLELINGYLCIYDAQGKILFVNSSMRLWLGYRNGSCPKNVMDFLNFEDFSELGPMERKLIIHKKNKDKMVVKAKTSQLKQFDIVIGGILLLEDITEQVKMETDLRNSKRQLTDIIESSPDATFVVDMEGKILYWNRAIAEMTGYTAEQMTGKGNYEHGKAFYNGKNRPLLIDMIVNPELEVSKWYTNYKWEDNVLGTDSTYAFFKGEQRIMWGRAAPLYDSKGQIVGAIETIRDITEHKKQQEALKKSRDQLQVVLNSTVHALAITTEKRDHYTAGHQERVSNLACAIAKEMNLSKNIIENIRVAGILHDIGKLYIPMEILSNSGHLSDIERLFLMTHSEAGFEIVKEIPFKGPIAKIIEQHHERIDGSGYPLGLKGKDILIEAKILAVADTVEAMSSHRPYRAALGIKKALKEIEKNAGKKYDRDVVNACLMLVREKGYQIV